MRKQSWWLEMRNLGSKQMATQSFLSTCIIIGGVRSRSSSMSTHCTETGLSLGSIHVVADAAANRRVVEGSTGIGGNSSGSRRPRPIALVSSRSALGFMFIH